MAQLAMGGEIKMEMTMQDLIDALGIETVMNELESWMSSDILEMFIEDVKRLYDLDYIE